ncbi:phage tail protein [Hafnia alvei]|uniref:phage tail protein n=1 Tax=Hafnia alvei TaxID=569 RepID=UPI0004707384|nr:phage tail protein [Hafnia alvei]
MAQKYKAVLTKIGAAKIAAATAGGTKINLTQMAVGDGGGTLPTPDPAQTKLIAEKHRAALNKVIVDPKHKNYLVAELVIPPEIGGFWMRELGLYDEVGALIAVSNMAESYKPLLSEGSGRAQTLRMVVIVSDMDTVNLLIDSSTVLATQEYVDEKLLEHEQSRRHPDATLKEKGFTQLSSVTNSNSEALAATPKAVKVVYDLANAKYTAQDATTTQKGIVQLNSATNSTSEALAATPKAVKTAFDKALAADENAKIANDNANTRLEKNKNLSDVPDKGKARASLELVKQTSPTDTTSGALLLNGGWGVGGYTIKSEIGLTGFFSLGAGSSENPDGNGFAHINMAVSGFYATRLAVSYAGAVPAAFLQTINGDTKNAWMPLLTSDNGLVKASNLSDVPNKETARNNLQLGDSATKNVGTIKNTVAAGDDNRIVGAMQKTNNLADLENKATSRSNLGLGTAATKNVGTGAGNVMEVGTRGWAALAPNGATDTVTSVYWGAAGSAFNPDSNVGYAHLNIAVSGTYRVRMAIQYSEGKAKVYVQNIGTNYGEWVQFYTTANKPTAADTGAQSDTRMGAEVEVGSASFTTSGNGRYARAPAGHALTGMVDYNNVKTWLEDIDAVLARPIQKQINGTWYTVSQL